MSIKSNNIEDIISESVITCYDYVTCNAIKRTENNSVNLVPTLSKQR